MKQRAFASAADRALAVGIVSKKPAILGRHTGPRNRGRRRLEHSLLVTGI